MTKYDLSKYKDLSKEIQILQKQMRNITVDQHIVSDTVKGSSLFFPYTEHTIKVSGVDAERYYRRVAQIRRGLARRIRDAMEQVSAINDYIAAVDDGEVRNILQCRYVECMTWEEIAGVLHMCERTARRKFRKWWESCS